MAKEAVIYSWYLIMYALLLKGCWSIPVLKEALHVKDPIEFFQQPFFRQGGDILLAATLGYVVGYIKAYFKMSA